MNRRIRQLAALTLVAIAGASLAADSLTDEQVRERVVAESIAAYPGNCPCPYNVDRAGRSCGGRSAWSKAGGYSPICYTTEVTDDQIRDYRARH
jgi:hypothetical protein